MFELRGRLAQVVYTLTQFTTVDRVDFKLEGKPIKVLYGMADPEDGLSGAVALDKPVTQATYRDHYLPLIFVDRPAWGAAPSSRGRVTGLANVNEAQFRMALSIATTRSWSRLRCWRPAAPAVGVGST